MVAGRIGEGLANVEMPFRGLDGRTIHRGPDLLDRRAAAD
jgi:hypothetical protein